MAEATAAVESETPKFSPVVELAAKVLFPDKNQILAALAEKPAQVRQATAPLESAYQWLDYQLNRFSSLKNLIEVPADPSYYGWLPEKHILKGHLGLPGVKRMGGGEHFKVVKPPPTPAEIGKKWQEASAAVKAKIQVEAKTIDQQREVAQSVLAGFEKALKDLGLTDISWQDLCVAHYYQQCRAGQIKEKFYYRFRTGRWGLVPDGRRVAIEMAVDKK